MSTESSRDTIIQAIVNIEEAMFDRVTNEGGRASCQDQLKTFRMMREIVQVAHSNAFLNEYLKFLTEAQEAGRNLMTEKYAIMQGLIPKDLNDTMEYIVSTEMAWMEEIKKQYPNLFKKEGRFRDYLEGEIQTFSDECVHLYYQEIVEAEMAKKNLVRVRYEKLYELLGRGSLAEANEKAGAAS